MNRRLVPFTARPGAARPSSRHARTLARSRPHAGERGVAALVILFVPLMVLVAPGTVRELADAESVG